MKKIPFSPPDITQAEIDEVVDTLRSGWITTGPKTKRFEREIADYCGTGTAVCLNSATACLELALHVLGIGPGDEVIVPAYTYTASASPVLHVGGTPVLVDSRPDSYEMDYDQMAAAITPRTKAVIPVDIGGILCDYKRIFSIVEEKKHLFTPSNEIQRQIGRVAVVADGAHSFGAYRGGRKSGSFADFTSFSFHAVKNLTTAEGGAVTWRDDLGLDSPAIYRQMMLLSLHGQDKDALAKTKAGAWEYDIVGPWYKCNMTDIMASIGLAQLRRYEKMLARRYELVSYYNKRLEGSGVSVGPHLEENGRSSCHLYLTQLPEKAVPRRNEIIESLAKQGVSTNVHYKPLPLLSAYRSLGYQMEDYPNAYTRYAAEITLPLYSTLTDVQAERVCDALLAQL